MRRTAPSRAPDPVRQLTLELWQDLQSGLDVAAELVARGFRRERHLAVAERQTIKERFYRLVAMARRIDCLLETTRARLDTPRAWDEARYVATMLLGGETDAAGAAALAPHLRVDWPAVAAADQALAADPDPRRRLALHGSLPDFLAALLHQQYCDEAFALAASLLEPAPITLRANLLKNTREQLIARLADEGVHATAGRFSPWAVHVQTPANVFRLAAFQDGLFEVQDEASQLVALLTAPPPRGLVVDACAGAGGKSLALAAILQNKGRIVAADPRATKIRELRRRMRRAGAWNVEPHVMAVEAWTPAVAGWAAKADRILTDVPCSGVGVLRRNPDARWSLDAVQVAELTRLQFDVASRAAAHLRPGARLVYATCTVLRQENEAVVERLLREVPGLEVVRAVEILGKETAAPFTDPSGTFLATLPHRHGMDGFFAAVLRRRA